MVPSLEDEKLILCDECNKAFHLYCLRPVLHRIPAGEWLCPACQPTVARRYSRARYPHHPPITVTSPHHSHLTPSTVTSPQQSPHPSTIISPYPTPTYLTSPHMKTSDMTSPHLRPPYFKTWWLCRMVKAESSSPTVSCVTGTTMRIRRKRRTGSRRRSLRKRRTMKRRTTTTKPWVTAVSGAFPRTNAFCD